MNRNLNLLPGGQLVAQVGDKFHMLAVAFMSQFVVAAKPRTHKDALHIFS
jgi:hypothetical protein